MWNQLPRVIKYQFGRVKVHCRGLKKNAAQLHALFNLWTTRGSVMAAQA